MAFFFFLINLLSFFLFFSIFIFVFLFLFVFFRVFRIFRYPGVFFIGNL